MLLLISLIAVLVFGTISVFIYDLVHCWRLDFCTAWGTFLSKFSLFGLSSFFFFMIVINYYGNGFKLKERRSAYLLIIPTFLLLLGGSYVAFQTYVVTDAKGIKSRDLINEFSGVRKKVSLEWNEVKEFGQIMEMKKTSRYGASKCLKSNVYFVLNDYSVTVLSQQSTSAYTLFNDYSFLDYLVYTKKVPYREKSINLCN